MLVPPKTKLEKVPSRDAARPAIANLYLRIVGEGDDRRGYLEGTDSYKLLRVPVELDEADTEGFVPTAAITAARKARTDRISCNGSCRVVGVDGSVLELERYNGTNFPSTDQLLDNVPARIEGDTWRIGLNPLFLLELAMGMGAETVELEFTAVKGLPDADGRTDFRPSNLRPMRVYPGTMLRGADRADDTVGLLMPVRVR